MSDLPRPMFDDMEQILDLTVMNTTLEFVDAFKSEKLFRLNFTRNQITSISHDAFLNCPRLETIDLSRNRLTSLPAKLLEGLRELNHINLSNNKLKNISQDFLLDNTHLKTVQLQSNSLEELSMDLFGNCTDLHFLDVSNNYLHKFTPSQHFLSMNTAEEPSILDLSNNLLASVDLRNTRITNVIVNSNYLRQLSIGHGCRELFAKNNALTDISLDSSTSTLEMLQMNYNKLANNLKSICECENLRSIFLAHNNITQIGFCFGKMRFLKEINLSGNHISHLDYGYFFADFLETLDLSYNVFEEIDDNILSLFQNLRYLYLDGNRLSDFPTDLDTIMPHLVLVGLSHNRFECKKLLTIYRRLKATNRIGFNADEPTPVNVTNIRGMICYKKNDSEIVEQSTVHPLNHLNVSNNAFWTELQKLKLKLETINDSSLLVNITTSTPLIANFSTQREILGFTSETPETTQSQETPATPEAEKNAGDISHYLPLRTDELENNTSTMFDNIFQALRRIEGRVKELGLLLRPGNATIAQPIDRANVRTFAAISVILAVVVLALGGGLLWYNYHSYFFYKKLRENNAEALRTFQTL
ncbi:leucine-rich repeat-containing protein 15-like [Phlebotomus argentipes]|uniref:leucine-rich repeat-containing protein 15-like n=1 Tax=Phlebotomus argentipes TaxID=94469 RepID=UPI0028931470|nr:leucine-rich repeat-containing protein 15-like [Phlebotomus argentipes]